MKRKIYALSKLSLLILLSVVAFVNTTNFVFHICILYAKQVERLVDRVQCSTLLDDRRDACRALKALSRQYRVEVGAQGMDALRQVLEMDRADGEIVSLVLDTLCNVMSSEVFEEEGKYI